MSHDLWIVSSRALSAADLSAAVAAVHQGRPWEVSDLGEQWRVSHCGRPLIEAWPSVRLDDLDQAGTLPPGGPSATAYLWRTRLTVLHDEDVDLGLEVARAAAWQTGGEVAERHS